MSAIGWDEAKRKFRTYIKIEQGLSANSVEAYMRDVEHLCQFIEEHYGVTPADVEAEMVEAFMNSLYQQGTEKTTQARALSGVKSFYRFLLLADLTDRSPAANVDAPKPSHLLPDTLSMEEVRSVLEGIDLSTKLGHRNRAIIEMLYGCGLRVSELVNLTLNALFFEEGYIRVTGKGNKQRLVPINDTARRQAEIYIAQRGEGKINPRNDDVLFLNIRGGKLTRQMVFYIIKEAVASAGINKTISPHTFRHSFASHLLQGGASIRQVQEMLGHESITTTEIYTHLDTSHLRTTLAMHHPLTKK